MRPPRLEGFDQAQVCVVGGGISGAILALKLAQAGIDVVVLEGRPPREPLTQPTAGTPETAASLPQNDVFPGLALAAQTSAHEMQASSVPGLDSTNLRGDHEMGARPDVPFGGVALRPTLVALARCHASTGSPQFEPETFARWMEEAARLLEASAPRLDRARKRHPLERGIEALGLRATTGDAIVSPQSFLLSAAEKAGARIYRGCFVRRVLMLGNSAVGLELDATIGLETDTAGSPKPGTVVGPAQGSAGASEYGDRSPNAVLATLSCACVVLAAGAIGSSEILRGSGVLAESRRAIGIPSFQLGIGLTGSFGSLPEGNLEVSDFPVYIQDLEGEGMTLAAGRGSRNGRTSTAGIIRIECLFSGGTPRGLLARTTGRTLDAGTLRRGIATGAEILFASGAERVAVESRKAWVFHRVEEVDPFLRGRVRLRRPEQTARHPVGSIRAGDDASRFPVSTEGEFREISGIWVTGASILPGSFPGPTDLPVATVAAMTAEALLRRLS